ncbi:MAG: NAD-dependent epimerase/dehydratase family protein, partial [Euzebyales bacterium]|nr:NAD-dependent epimerase/dehydratase family protein [Euzebyales bacterium]
MVDVRILVTGATGNVGSALLHALTADPSVTEVVGVARRRPDIAPEGVRWHRADIAIDDLRPALSGVDALVHLAWLLQPSHDEAAQWRANVGGTRRVLEAASAAGVGCVAAITSVGAYSRGPGPRPIGEDWPTDGVATSAYSRQKAYTERLLDTFEARHPDVRVLRFRPGLIFQAGAASEIRRLFGGPLVPSWLLRRVGVPVVPDTPGLRLQV